MELCKSVHKQPSKATMVVSVLQLNDFQTKLL